MPYVLIHLRHFLFYQNLWELIPSLGSCRKPWFVSQAMVRVPTNRKFFIFNNHKTVREDTKHGLELGEY